MLNAANSLLDKNSSLGEFLGNVNAFQNFTILRCLEKMAAATVAPAKPLSWVGPTKLDPNVEASIRRKQGLEDLEKGTRGERIKKFLALKREVQPRKEPVPHVLPKVTPEVAAAAHGDIIATPDTPKAMRKKVEVKLPVTARIMHGLAGRGFGNVKYEKESQTIRMPESYRREGMTPEFFAKKMESATPEELKGIRKRMQAEGAPALGGERDVEPKAPWGSPLGRMYHEVRAPVVTGARLAKHVGRELISKPLRAIVEKLKEPLVAARLRMLDPLGRHPKAQAEYFKEKLKPLMEAAEKREAKTVDQPSMTEKMTGGIAALKHLGASEEDVKRLAPHVPPDVLKTPASALYGAAAVTPKGEVVSPGAAAKERVQALSKGEAEGKARAEEARAGKKQVEKAMKEAKRAPWAAQPPPKAETAPKGEKKPATEEPPNVMPPGAKPRAGMSSGPTPGTPPPEPAAQPTPDTFGSLKSTPEKPTAYWEDLKKRMGIPPAEGTPSEPGRVLPPTGAPAEAPGGFMKDFQGFFARARKNLGDANLPPEVLERFDAAMQKDLAIKNRNPYNPTPNVSNFHNVFSQKGAPEHAGAVLQALSSARSEPAPGRAAVPIGQGNLWAVDPGGTPGAPAGAPAGPTPLGAGLGENYVNVATRQEKNYNIRGDNPMARVWINQIREKGWADFDPEGHPEQLTAAVKQFGAPKEGLVDVTRPPSVTSATGGINVPPHVVAQAATGGSHQEAARTVGQAADATLKSVGVDPTTGQKSVLSSGGPQLSQEDHNAIEFMKRQMALGQNPKEALGPFFAKVGYAQPPSPLIQGLIATGGMLAGMSMLEAAGFTGALPQLMAMGLGPAVAGWLADKFGYGSDKYNQIVEAYLSGKTPQSLAESYQQPQGIGSKIKSAAGRFFGGGAPAAKAPAVLAPAHG